MKADVHIGVLIIELASRRRLRVNGLAVRANDALAVTVEESFANCPKYITRREIKIEPRERIAKRRARFPGSQAWQATNFDGGSNRCVVRGHRPPPAWSRRFSSRRKPALRGSRGCKHVTHPGLLREQPVQHPRESAG